MLILIRFLSSFLVASLSSSISLGQGTAFKYFKGIYTQVGPSKEVSNMPKVKAQGPYDICTAYSTQYIIQHNICKQLNISPCSNATPEQEVSPINLSAFANPNSKDLERGPLTHHTNLNLINDGLSGFYILYSSNVMFSLRPESCFPSDVFNNLVGNNRDLAEDFVAWLNSFYQENRDKTECKDCLTKINNSLKANRTETQITRALAMKSFPEFLYAIIFPEGCGKFIRPPKKPSVEFFPEKMKPATADDLAKVIERVLSSDRPVQIDGVCTGGFIENQCKGGHALVISGYKTICPSGNNGVCRKLYKIQNTWGQEWQDQNNDGWMDAEHLLKNVKTPYTTGVLSWLE